jgi:FlgD Ig-like domain
MAPAFRSARRFSALALTSLLLTLLAPAAHALRIVDYNILNYPGSSAPTRNPKFRIVLAPLNADVIVTEETLSQAGVDQFLNNVLNVMEPGQWAAMPFVDGNDTDAGLFYKPAKVVAVGQTSFYPNGANQLRLVHVYTLRPVGYTSPASEFRLYALHLKASNTTADANQRTAEATGLRDSLNNNPPGTHAMAVGDFNCYRGTEGAITKLLELQADNDGRLYDPLGLQNLSSWQDNATIAIYHTQSPCLSGCLNGGATGGLDDRFDLILPTLNWNDGQGYELIPGTYASVGNDGLHLGGNITDAPTIPEGATYADALWSVSDHLPVRVDIQLPAKSDVPASLALGTVIVGGGADLSVSNPAVAPADALTYSFAAPSGFTAPAGTFNLAPGAAAASHTIATSAGPLGPRAGTLTLTSDDFDNPTRSIGLTANVLGHAAASVDSASLQVATDVDFGAHAAGSFTTASVRVHNFGSSVQQARLSLTGAAVTGGDGRFSIVGGFSPALLADVGQTIELSFDDAGATQDSTYTATLLVTSADEPLPGAQPQPDVVVTMSARVTSGSVAVGTTTGPTTTQLYAPFPNPLRYGSTVRFDLATGDDVRLAIYDLSGRLVTTLAQQNFAPGRYAYRWDGRDGSGATAEPGLYFIRLSGAHITGGTARIAVLK